MPEQDSELFPAMMLDSNPRVTAVKVGVAPVSTKMND